MDNNGFVEVKVSCITSHFLATLGHEGKTDAQGQEKNAFTTNKLDVEYYYFQDMLNTQIVCRL